MSTFAKMSLDQIDALIPEFEALIKKSKHHDLSDLPDAEISQFLVGAMAAIHRIAGATSQYAQQCATIIDRHTPYHLGRAVPHVGGALKALRVAVAAGHLASLQELVHSNLFSDFLEMAEHLLNEGYKDPAAVLIGGVLEEHLRKLCDKNGIPTETPDAKGVMRAKKADTMNSDLSAASVYGKLDLKNVTAWLDLRNKAAHGHYSDYASPQVELLLQSVRDFLTRQPA